MQHRIEVWGAMRENVEFVSQGSTLRGWLQRPEAARNAPAVVMAHGFGGLKDWLQPQSAALADAGIASLVYDHAHFGDSDGSPRQHIDPAAQVHGYRDAITFLSAQPGIDADRIGLWGTSLAGAVVMVAGAVDTRVKAVVSQIPMVDPNATLRRMIPGSAVAGLLAQITADRVARYAGADYQTIPISGPGPEVALPDPETAEFIAAHAAADPNFRNEITLASLDLLLEFTPHALLPHISPRPLLMTIADNDTLCPTDLALAAYDTAREPKQLHLVAGGHHSPYSDQFESVITRQASFLRAHLADGAAA
jgi:uncharacterized protein